ncbi:MAG: hypothetical protein K2K60_01260 [Clostridia bacterium]|nr:hypothetical protein [Clostridia bacterium]
METLITITMNAQEYELYQTQKRLAAEAHHEIDQWQEEYSQLAELVYSALVFKGEAIHFRDRSKACELLQTAQKILGIKDGDQ